MDNSTTSDLMKYWEMYGKSFVRTCDPKSGSCQDRWHRELLKIMENITGKKEYQRL